jgi:RNA polymerase sigma factor (sigma-70 family)
MIEDSELLRRYVEERSQAAFSELVQRRVNLVYSVALRQVGGDAHLAEDVTQKVFADLARKAPSLLGRPVLSGWLYRSAQFAGTDVVRSERRRRAREQETQIMNDLSTKAGDRAGDWEKLRPVLDEAMGELNEEDRDAVALRFFEERPFADIGRALRLTEDTARKRVDRALDKLNAALSRRGVTSTMSALGLALANQVVTAAPSGLAASATGAALTGAGATAGWASLQVLGSTKMILGAVGAATALGLGAVAYEVKQANLRSAAPPRTMLTPPAKLAGTMGASALPGAVQVAATTVEDALPTDQEAAYLRAVVEQSNPSPDPKPQTIVSTAPAEPSSGAIVLTHPATGQSVRLFTQDEVQARYMHARVLARNGQKPEALKEYLWCFDEGMVQVPSFIGVRVSYLLRDITDLGKIYPPALAALRERRDAFEKQLMRVPVEYPAASPYVGINKHLGETERTMALLDQFARGELRWKLLARLVYDDLIERRRYQEASEARPYAVMLTWLEENLTYAKNAKTPQIRASHQRFTITLTLKNIEVLAGTNDLAHARELIAKLLAVDSSAATLTKLRAHLTQARHPELMPQGQ